MTEQPLYKHFIANWRLMPETCNYEQGEAPIAGSYTIEEGGKGLIFTMRWTDTAFEQHDISFTACPDGKRHAFDGGALADALSVTAVSKSELISAAFKGGMELMLATLTLSENGNFLDLKQVVRLPDLTEPSNLSRYKRQ
jgi:hypothetical protein